MITIQKTLFFCGALALALMVSSCNKEDDGAGPSPPVDDKTVTLDCAEATIDTNTTWPDVLPSDAVDYIVKCAVTVKGTAVLTLEPGVTVQFEGSSSGINTEENAGFNAVGTVDNPIRMIGSLPSKGAWQGVVFGSNNVANQLSYVTILHAGGEKASWTDQKAAINLGGYETARAAISHCTVAESDGYGVWVNRSQNLAQFNNNTISDCSQAPVALSFDLLNQLDATSTYQEGNDDAYIDVYEGSGEDGSGHVKQAVTVRALDVPYRISDEIYIDKTLTIEPGVEFEFSAGAGLFTEYGSSGTITAVGTADQRIVFRGAQEGKGAWIGLWLCSSQSPANQLIYCDISGGGSEKKSLASGKGNVVLGGNGDEATLTLQNSTIFDSGGWGVFTSEESVLTESGNTFAGNAQGDIGKPE